jgi:ParB/RepB/Spo0J family partition protein
MASTRPTRGIGTAATTLKRPTGARSVSLVSALQAHDDDQNALGPSRLHMLALSSIAAHPQNPRDSLGDLQELTASIREFGVLQPPVVIPAAAFAANWPEHVEAIGGADWVIVAGHRRHAAAHAADLTEIAVIVREDLATREAAAAAFVVENVHRAALEPLEEAQAYGLLADLGISQRDIARRTGVSQSHVSKRLSLLGLPQPAQDALAAGELVVTEALALAAVDVADQAHVWEVARTNRIPVASAATSVQRDTEGARRREAGQTAAAAEGVEVIDPVATFGSELGARILTRAQDVEAARAAGSLVGGVDDRGLTYYTTAPLQPDTQADNGTDTAERRKAVKARRAACADLVAKPPARAEALEDLIRAVADGNLEHGEAARLVHTVGQGSGHQHWLEQVMRDTREETRLHVAWALTVARDEIRTSATWASWGSEQATHLERLRERTGYVPTAWEQAKLVTISQ